MKKYIKYFKYKNTKDFIVLLFLGYLWIAELEAKKNKAESIDNNLNYLSSKV